MDHSEFQQLVWEEGGAHYRPMPWRDEPTFYHVLVSEIMLQQTQVPRVIVKYASFMHKFPTIESLAQAPLSAVLEQWQGLGYNRRAKFLHEAAKSVVASGVPHDMAGLIKLPGVGKNTAGAIMNYVYEQPTAFIETNIRTVYFEHYFQTADDVSDTELIKIVADTIDTEHPREWFYALMDYGSVLKAQGQGRLDQSRHYKKQAPLAGSVREVRGYIIAELTASPSDVITLKTKRPSFADRFEQALDGLIKDGLVVKTDGHLKLND